MVALASLSQAACESDSTVTDPAPSAGDLASPGPVLGASFQRISVIPGHYIVTVRPDVTDVPDLARRLVQTAGGTLRYTYTSALRGFAAELPAHALEGLRRNPHVTGIHPDQTFEAEDVESPAPWGLDRLDQRTLPLDDQYAPPAGGAGVTAYIIDTGIWYTHADFGGRASYGFDAFGGLGTDCNGHGTHVAGTVGGLTYGVAKAVKLVGVRVLDCAGRGSTSTVVAGIDWVVRHAHLPAVANLSLGGAADSLVDAAIQRLVATGVATAVAAGNSTMDACQISPARVPEAMTVGASDSTDAAASFSNYGPCVDWYAPGVAIVSASNTDNTGTAIKSGTSMASPHVAGAAALYLEQEPTASPQQISATLAAGTTKGRISSVRWTDGSIRTGDLLYVAAASGGPPTNSAPTARFSSVCTGSSCDFTDQSSDLDGTVADWQWTFGDLATASGRNPSHTYAAAGTYRVTLQVRDDDGATGTYAQDIVIAPPAGNLPPAAAFLASCQGLTCAFSDASRDPDGTLAKWEWSYGDGASSITRASTELSHAFDVSGVYNVTLTVTDNAGASASTSQALRVGVILSAVSIKSKGKVSASLTWTGATTSNVAIRLNGSLLATVANTGSYTYRPSARGQATYRFAVCETGAASPVCSAEQTLVM